MNDQDFSITFDGACDQTAADRRKIQNRVAQRKHREKIKAHRRNFTGGGNETFISNHYNKSADQNETLLHALNDIQHDLNIPGSTNEYHGQLVFPQGSTNELGLQCRQIQSHGSAYSPRQDNQGSQYFSDQLLSLNAPRNDKMTETDRQILTNQNNSEQPRRESVRRLRAYINNQNTSSLQQDLEVTKEATAVVQSQRSRICDQAEQHLGKALSLYDFGVSLDILAADPYLRDLLVHASDSFRDRRLVDTSDGNDPVDFNQNQFL